jgi:hypothetical protein
VVVWQLMQREWRSTARRCRCPAVAVTGPGFLALDLEERRADARCIEDLDDLELIAPRTTADALVDRWNQLVKWHGDRHAILGFADALVDQLQQRFGCDPVAIIARLEVTAGHRALLLDTYRGKGSE